MRVSQARPCSGATEKLGAALASDDYVFLSGG
jgi:hypothetical protein